MRGLVINRFLGSGIALGTPTGTDGATANSVMGNFIGTDPSGSIDRGNGVGVSLSAPGNTVGGTIPAARNLISGNNTGVQVNNVMNNNVLLSHDNLITGNYIGTDKNGTAALGNSTNGVFVLASYNQIGGTQPGAGNLISGNLGSGIELQGASAANNLVVGNLIGTNATGDGDLGNTMNGVRINTAPNNTVGGATSAARNVISGNNAGGVNIVFSAATNNRVLGNFIGTDAAGLADLGNNSGVEIGGAPANFIGGTVPGEGNLISGNTFYGVVLNSATATGNRVEGNRIGINAAGGPLGNQHGVYIVNSSSNATVGGPGDAANIIAFNSSTGVFLNSTAGTGNDISGNSIFSNGGLGIDLLGAGTNFGVTANDSLDQDSGPNNLQNYPVLTGITGGGNSATVEGQLHSAANTTYVLDFYRNNAVDFNGFGEGQNFIGFVNVQTDAQGNSTFSFPLGSNASGQFITATATDPGGNTSEFSQASAMVPGPTPTPTVAPTPPPAPTKLANIATRLRVETGDNALIGGLIVTGLEPKRLIVRAIGPSLNLPGALENPQLEIYRGSELIAANDNWRDAANQQEIIDSTVAPNSDIEAAVLTTLEPGAYTAIVSGVGAQTGIGSVEVYDLNLNAESSLANIATRGFVQTGDNVMIAGLIVTGSSQQKVIVRAIGPSLGVEEKLLDPSLELYDGNGALMTSNNNWKDTQQSAIEETTIPPSNDLEAAIVTFLPPAAYTAIVRGVGETTGVALVEVYALQ